MEINQGYTTMHGQPIIKMLYICADVTIDITTTTTTT
jgi:hypothetical protein